LKFKRRSTDQEEFNLVEIREMIQEVKKDESRIQQENKSN